MESDRIESDDPEYDSDGSDHGRRCQRYQSDGTEAYAERTCGKGLRGERIRISGAGAYA